MGLMAIMYLYWSIWEISMPFKPPLDFFIFCRQRSTTVWPLAPSSSTMVWGLVEVTSHFPPLCKRSASWDWICDHLNISFTILIPSLVIWLVAKGPAPKLANCHVLYCCGHIALALSWTTWLRIWSFRKIQQYWHVFPRILNSCCDFSSTRI